MFFKIKILYNIRPYLNTDLRIKVCETLILSKLNYADTVYGPCLLARTQKLIQRVQNACARFCFNIAPRAHVTPYLNNSNLLKLQARRQLHFATLLFKIIKTRSPDYLYTKLDWSSTHNRHNTRASSYMLVTPSFKTAAFRGSFKYAASKCWNNLPPPIRALKTVKTFSTRLKIYLIAMQKLNKILY